MSKPRVCFALSGSGSQLIAEVGAMAAALKVFEPVAIGGTSGGAITAAAFASGLSADDVKLLCMDVFSGGILRRLHFWDWARRRWGLYSMRPVISALKENLPKRMGEYETRWGVVVCPAATARGLVLRSDDEPERLAVQAIAASAAIPLFFEPVVVEGHGRCFDGGTFANTCADMWDDIPFPTIVVRVGGMERRASPPESAPEYVGSVLATLINAANSTHVSKKKWARTCVLNPPGSGMNMQLSTKEVRARFDYGFDAMARWIEDHGDAIAGASR